MALRTRIAVTFILLLATALAAALGAVSATNRVSAGREVQRQIDIGASVFQRLLESNQRQLTQAAQAVAADYGFREAVSTRDTDTLVSVLENAGQRIGAAMVVLTSLDGDVIAASGSHVKAGTQFLLSPEQKSGAMSEGATTVRVDGGRIYQLVTVPVRSPLPVAWIAMGFELDAKQARELADLTGLAVMLSVDSGGHSTELVSAVPTGEVRSPDVVTRRIALSRWGNASVVATLSRSLADARAPFERLTKVLYLIAVVSFVASALAALWLARNITRPLQDLTRAVDQMRGGTYDVALRVARRDELGVLAEGLQLMQSAVQSRDQSIRRLAYEDMLTGLMNRTAFVGELSQALSANRSRIAVAILNLNRFRRINEHLGYSVGDAVLTEIAVRLATVPTVRSAVARLAADQFAAFTRLEDDDNLQGWGTSLIMALADPVWVAKQPIDISVTLGLALAGSTGTSADELMRCADLALERARSEKRALAVYEETLKPAAIDQLSLLGELRRAVEQNELQLFFQPKIELCSGRVSGAEVLLRWQHPTRGLLSPADFIPFAEQTGFIRRLTRWTLERAVGQAAAWQRAGKPIGIAVNISVDDVSDVRLDSRVAGMLSRHQLPPALLTLEITESGFFENPARALRVLEAIAALGVSLSIDDFGTGYSSLSHLARMPVHEMKIDRSFVNGLESDAEFAPVVRAAIDMGHGLGLKVVAEGIETEAAAARLKELGCDIGQGYLYARPMPLATFEAWLEGRERIPVIAVPVDFPIEDVADTVTLALY
ncbi:MAG TPA: EAL domain-containing protein [Steroidobacteraceae bacterium]|jgi:diguanylate cyclase (GGDEF)-like protein|nr:EAL domain-containing protein [Steroidobacteraceae bacterium]